MRKRKTTNGSAGCDFGQLLYDQAQKDRELNGQRYEHIGASLSEIKETLANMNGQMKIKRDVLRWVLGGGGMFGAFAGIRAIIKYLNGSGSP